MSELNNDNKLSILRDAILKHANAEKEEIISAVAHESAEWLIKEKEKLEQEKISILENAEKKANEAHRRQLITADKEKSMSILRMQNKIISEAMNKLQDSLLSMRNRNDYADILTGMCIEAAETLNTKTPLLLRLAPVDSLLGQKIISEIKKCRRDINISFDRSHAPISGGCIVSTASGNKEINMSWQSLAAEMMDTLVKRLLPIL